MDQGQIFPHSKVCSSAGLPRDFLTRLYATGMFLYVCSTVVTMQILLRGRHYRRGMCLATPSPPQPLPRLRNSLQPEDNMRLRPALNQCFQEGVTELWPALNLKREGREDGS